MLTKYAPALIYNQVFIGPFYMDKSTRIVGSILVGIGKYVRCI